MSVEHVSVTKRRFDVVDVDVSDVKVYNLLILNLLTTIKKKFLIGPVSWSLKLMSLFLENLGQDPHSIYAHLIAPNVKIINVVVDF